MCVVRGFLLVTAGKAVIVIHRFRSVSGLYRYCGLLGARIKTFRSWISRVIADRNVEISDWIDSQGQC